MDSWVKIPKKTSCYDRFEFIDLTLFVIDISLPKRMFKVFLALLHNLTHQQIVETRRM